VFVFGLAVVGMSVRLRHASATERQQVKWISFALTFVVAKVAVGELIPSTTYDAFFFSMAALAAMAIAAGIAIARHRLYDIDVVINHTLVYGGVTATLAAAYLGSGLVLQLVLSGVTSGNGLAVAGSTLAVAALFQPARRRMQATVDRRFFRRKYDAARTLERFGTRLRDEVDLDALSAELRGVVAETMQPAHVSLWLRGAAR